jgi:hypothetical protein
MSQEHQPVTREDLDRFKTELTEAIRSVVQETVPGIVRDVIQQTVPAMIQETVPGIVRDVIQETVPAMIQETETKLLNAFFLYQEHAEIKYRKLSADVTNVNAAAELRLGNLESRVIELEKRFLMGGPRQ